MNGVSCIPDALQIRVGKLHVRIQQSAPLRLGSRNRELQSFWCDYQFEIWDELKVTTSQALTLRGTDVYQIAELLLS